MCQNVIVVLASENTTVPTACCGFQKYSPSLPQGDSIKQASAMVAKTEKKKKKKKLRSSGFIAEVAPKPF
ncbi:hypothetical protein QG37_06306 [Candidozyma auris]|uniref:Uncharacterized protein n=1 Tax=Candidozyma auris TaxID=498019 RepID=A0A0L0NT31_CANAR|nr:hypothetical protein QG37_06306 [[Candida] auris]